MPLYRFRLLFVFFLLACCGKPGTANLEHITGYWEIREVRFPDGGQREYAASANVEYFEADLEKQRGFRKKVQPQVDGRFRTSDDALPMTWSVREGRLFLRFAGAPEPWEEEVLELGPQRLVTRHANGLVYAYEPYTPLDIMNNPNTE